MWVAWMGCTAAVWKCWTGSSKSVIFSLKFSLISHAHCNLACNITWSTISHTNMRTRYTQKGVCALLIGVHSVHMYPLQHTLRVNLPKWGSRVSPPPVMHISKWETHTMFYKPQHRMQFLWNSMVAFHLLQSSVWPQSMQHSTEGEINHSYCSFLLLGVCVAFETCSAIQFRLLISICIATSVVSFKYIIV